MVRFLAIASVLLPRILHAQEFENPLGSGAGSLLAIICNVRDGIFPLLLGFAVIAFIAAGLLYFFGGQNEQRLGTAKKALIAAIIGTAVAILSFGLPAIVAELFNVPASEIPDNC